MFRYGTDVIFTTGPLGFIMYPENLGANLGIAMAVLLAFWAVLIWQLLKLYRSGGPNRRRAALMMTGLVFGHFIIKFSVDYYLVALMMVLLVRLHSQSWQRTELTLVAVTSGVLMLMKFPPISSVWS